MSINEKANVSAHRPNSKTTRIETVDDQVATAGDDWLTDRIPKQQGLKLDGRDVIVEQILSQTEFQNNKD